MWPTRAAGTTWCSSASIALTAEVSAVASASGVTRQKRWTFHPMVGVRGCHGTERWAAPPASAREPLPHVVRGRPRPCQTRRVRRMSRLGNGGHRRGAPLVVLALVGRGAGRGMRRAQTDDVRGRGRRDGRDGAPHLRRWNNDLTEVFNATSQQITDDDDPDTAGDVLVDGFDEMIELASDHRDEVDGLDLPAAGWRDDLIAELAAGPTSRSRCCRTSAARPPTCRPSRSTTRAAQSAARRWASSGRPRCSSPRWAHDPVLGAAFAADEGCEHVVQPF